MKKSRSGVETSHRLTAVALAVRPRELGLPRPVRCMAALALGLPLASLAGTVDVTGGCAGGATVTVGRNTVGPTTVQASGGSDTSSTVLGCEANGNNHPGATAIGSYSLINGGGGTAYGFNSLAGRWSTAVGLEAQASGTGSTALGFGTFATGLGAIAIGGVPGANGTTPLSAALGIRASGNYSIAIGADDVRGAEASGRSAVAIGSRAVASGVNAQAFGGGAHALGPTSIALGVGATSSGTNSVTVGSGANADQASDVAVGNQARATGTGTGGSTVALGSSSAANGQGANALGSRSTATGQYALAVGREASATADGASALGYTASASGQSSLGMGYAAQASGATAIAVGNAAVGSATNAVALGNGAQATGAQSISVGTGSIVSGTGSGAFGDPNQVTGNDSYAFGNNNTVASDNAFVLGNNVNLAAGTHGALALGHGTGVTQAGGVALGAGAVSDRTIASSSGSIPAGSALVPYNTGDRTLLGAVSVGNATSYRQITNVADGTQAQDAVTLRQLSGALSSFAVTPLLYFHANSTATDALAVGLDAVAVGPQTVVNGDRGIGMGSGATVQSTAPGGIAIGQQAAVQLADAVALGTQASAAAVQGLALGAASSVTQATGVALGSSAVSDRAIAPATGSIAAGTASIAYNTMDRTLAGAVSVGNATTYRQITHVADGTQDFDAVNLRQLTAALASIPAAPPPSSPPPPPPPAPAPDPYFKAHASGPVPQASGDSTIAVGPSTVVDAPNGVGIGNHATVQGGAAGGVAIGNGASSQAPSSVALGAESVASAGPGVPGYVPPQATAEQRAALEKTTSTLGAVAVGDAANGKLRQITGVAAGTQDSDAANIAQLRAAANAAANQWTVSSPARYVAPSAAGSDALATGSGAVAAGTASTATGTGAQSAGANATALGYLANASALNAVALGANAVAERAPQDSYTAAYVGAGQRSAGEVSVGSAGAERQITNVAPGMAGTDAVNLNQLGAAMAEVNARVDKVRREAAAGTAAAMAMAGMPQAYQPGRNMLSAGVGSFRGQTALAVGVSRLSDNGSWVVKAGLSADTRGSVGANIGAGFHF